MGLQELGAFVACGLVGMAFVFGDGVEPVEPGGGLPAAVGLCALWIVVEAVPDPSEGG